MRWEDEDCLTVVYDIRTGDTHLVEDVAMALLGLIRQSPLDVETLAAQLVDFFLEDDPQRIQEFVGATLLQLKALGLVTDAAH
jgi:PqqD family protein of HPr-rel-A system